MYTIHAYIENTKYTYLSEKWFDDTGKLSDEKSGDSS